LLLKIFLEGVSIFYPCSCLNGGTIGMRLGIDFGTTRTVVAAEEDGKYPVCTFTLREELKEYIPSLVAAKDGRLYFGWEAAQHFNEPGVHVLRSIKRLAGHLRPEDPVNLGPGISISMLDLVTSFLSHVRRMVIGYGNLRFRKKPKIEVMVATPANANSNQRYITLEAFRRTGFIVLGAMNEPSSAAVEFLHRYLRSLGSKSLRRYIVVYDLGGGTFDTSVVRIAEHGHDVLAHEGIARLGGDDFDEIILNAVLEKVGMSSGDLDPSDMVRLLEECRERKEGLNFNTKKMVVDVGRILQGMDPVVLETGAIYERCGPLIQKSLEAVQTLTRALDSGGINAIDPRSLAAIYLVGGSVSFPPVARTLREVYANKVKVSPFPHASTAIGLAIAANPEARIEVRESVSRHFGVWREQGKDKVFDPVFLKDRGVDPDTGRLEITRIYRPVHNVGLLRYLECTSLGKGGEPEGDIALWKDVYFPYDPELKRLKDLTKIPVEPRPDLCSQEILETYQYDREGIIRVQIENRTSGYKKRFTLGPESSH
jgi:molecular chaperone DnaK (HSP70)